MLLTPLLLFISYVHIISAKKVDVLNEILSFGTKMHFFPGAVGFVGNGSEILYSTATGHHTYDESSPLMDASTIFDMASCSKVLATTSAVASLYEKGHLGLDTYVKDILGDDFSQGGKGPITVRNCLLHNAGFLPDPDPWYWSSDFNCPNTDNYIVKEDFTCIDQVYDSLLQEKIQTEVGTEFKYSDLSFITLQMVAGKTVKDKGLVSDGDLSTKCSDALSSNAGLGMIYSCYFEAYTRINVLMNPALPRTGATYLLSEDLWSQAAPTINDTQYLHRRVQGQVSDGNCYAMGGVCGHAGLFGTGHQISGIMQYLVGAPSESTGFLNATTVELFTTLQNPEQSSRALGWDTNSRDETVSDQGFTNSCGNMPEETFMHIGYTGTCVCGVRGGLWTVILTNRVYNCDGQSCPSELSTYVKDIYRRFNSMAYKLYA
jgi:serine-type D-Ala-D-Ala carboxypeptidase